MKILKRYIYDDEHGEKIYEFDDINGTPFFVLGYTREDAQKTAEIYFEDPKCYGRVSYTYAQEMGYDVY